MSDLYPGQAYPFLNNGGEMGHLVRNYPWSCTPLGAPATWPQSLRTAAGIVLNSSFPMFLYWGSDMIGLYNDAFRPSLGDSGKHPSLLGQTGEEGWPEIKDRIDFLRTEILEKGRSVYQEDAMVPLFRNGRLENAYWVYSYSPVIAEDGKPGGILVTCYETTQKVITQQHLQEKAEQLEFALTATGLGTWDADLATQVSVINARLRTLFGFHPSSGIKMQDFLDCVVPGDLPRVTAALEQALQGHGAYEVEHGITNKITGQRLEILAKGKVWFDDNGRPYRITGTVQDITVKASALRSLTQSEKRFRSLIEQAPIATCLFVGPELRIEVANEGMIRFWGRGTSVIGKPLREAVPELEGQPFLGILDEVYRTGVPYVAVDTPATLRVDGVPGTYYFDFTYKPLVDENGQVYAIMEIATDVTDRLLVRQEIDDAQRNLLALFEETPAAIATFSGDDELRFLTANVAYGELAGRPPHELIGKPLLEALPELKGQGFDGLLKQVLATGETYSAMEIPVTLYRNDQLQTRYVDFSYIARRNAAGVISGVLVTATDITGQVVARQEIERSEALFKTLVNSAPFPIGVYTGRDMRILHANPAIIEVYGKGPDVIGKSYIGMLPELSGQGIFEQLQEVYTTGREFHSGIQRVDINIHGELTAFYFSYDFFPLFDASGEVYGVLNTAVNVTELELSRQRALTAEANLRDAIELAELAEWSFDAARQEFTLSERLQAWKGIDQAIVEAEACISTIAQEHQANVRRAIAQAVAEGEGASLDVEYLLFNQVTGYGRYLHAIGQVNLTAQGTPVLRGVIQDITEQRNLQLQLERQVAERTTALAAINTELIELNATLGYKNTELLKSNEELAQYAYVTSHDLQEPLRKIRIFVSMMLMKQGMAEEHTRTLGKIESAATRMTQLINDLLKFSRLLQKEQLSQPVSLSGIVSLVVEDHELAIAEKHATVKVGPLPEVPGVALQLNQLFNNLLSNALKFSAPGRHPRIEISASRMSEVEVSMLTMYDVPPGMYEVITVKDNGIGFSQAYAEQIFEIFKRLHGREAYPGSGIGLALCRRIMANHNGFLHAVSVPDRGSCFYAIFPAAAV